MHRIRSALILVGLLSVGGPASAVQPDYQREARYAEDLRHGTLVGEVLELQADERPFANLFSRPEQPTADAVILVHGRGLSPNWPSVIQPLRIGLTQSGRATLSLQMPVLARGSDYWQYTQIFPQAMPRLRAAVRFLRQQGYQRIHLVAHSCGAQMVM